MPAFARITVTVDGSPHSERALDAAIELAKPFHSTLTLISVVPLYVNYAPAAVPPASYYEEEEKAYEKLLSDSADRVTRSGVANVTTIRLRGLVVPELLAFLDNHPSDLVVLGARGLSTGGRLFLGSTSDAVVHHVRSPVLIVKGPDAPR
ncbi:MAG: universal stress protein [Thermoplasmata archaeon]|nr:universal stress protein [Thermoplasmata archaeon]